jgi:signal transduction histidine kinase
MQTGSAIGIKLPKYFRIWVMLILAVALIIAMSSFLSQRLQTLNEGAGWVAHTERVRFQLARVLQSLSDLGSGVGGYQITHDESLFEPATTAEAQVPVELQDLQALLAEDAAQRPLLAELIDLAHQRQLQTQTQRKLALSQDTAGVQAGISSGEGKRLMDACRAVIAQMQAEERHLLDVRSKATRAAYTAVAIASWATAGLAILLLVSITVITLRDAERLRRVQEEFAIADLAARRALIESRDALAEADRRKDVFLATLSHELRNPLAPIRTATRVLEAPDLSAADLERSRSIIARQVRHMASLLDDLLDISRITRGVLTLKNEPVDLRALMEAAIETAQPLLTAKQHSFRVEWPAEPMGLTADPLRLTQVIANLLTNAAKYTNSGGHIVLGARSTASSIEIYVRDDGIGIAAAMLPKVFDMFSQIDRGNEHSEGGIGIGLALVKGFVELHGGSVEAHSAGLDRGSEFQVLLPSSLRTRTPVAPAPERMAPGGSRGARRVLIADDNRDGAEIMAMLLTHSGFEVQVAHTGPEALAVAERQKPDFAVLDIGMPGMSGYEVARGIRGQSWGSAITLIAMTGWGQEDDKRKAKEAGFDHHLTKPIEPGVLEQMMTVPQPQLRG